MRLIDWRTNKNLVGWMAKLIKTAEWQELVAMLEEEHVKNYGSGLVTNESTASQKLGRIEGYDMAMNNLIASGVLIEKKEPMPEATFDPVIPTTQ